MALTKDKIPNGSLAITKRGRYATLFWKDNKLYAVTDAVSKENIATIYPQSREGDLEKDLARYNIIKIFGEYQERYWGTYTWSRLEMYGVGNRELLWEDPEYIDYKKPSAYKSIDQYEPWEVCSLVHDMGYYIED